MDVELFKIALLKIQNVTQKLYLHVLGEPTLHPHFFDFLEQINKTHLKLDLTTNGILIKNVKNNLLSSNALRQINFSTHAYAEVDFEKAKHYFQDLLDFSIEAMKIKPDLYINFRLWNIGDENSTQWNNYVLQKLKETLGVQINLSNFCSRHKSFLVKNRLYIHQDSRFEWPAIQKNTNTLVKSIKGTCRALSTHVAILHDGRVVACCLDYSGQITLGRIQEASIEEILSSPLAINLRDGFANHELRHPFCQSCTFCKRFK